MAGWTPVVATLLTLALYGTLAYAWLNRRRAWRRLTRRRRTTRMMRQARLYDEPRWAEQKAAYAPEQGERVRCLCLWLVEAYPPSRVRGLTRALDRLGVNEGLLGDRDLGDIVRSSRGSYRSGGWFSLPLMTQHAQWIGSHVAIKDMPKGVRAIQGKVYTPASDLTLAVLQFILDEDEQLAMDEAMREDVRPRYERRDGGGYSSVGVEGARSASVDRANDAIRGRCIAWLGKNMPGAFCGGLNHGRPPVFQLVSTQRFDPAGEDNPLHEHYSRLLPFRARSYAWKNEVDLPGLRLIREDRWRPRTQSGWFLVGRWGSLLSMPSLRIGGGRLDDWTVAQRVDDYFQGTAIVLALYELLGAYHARLAELRDVERRLTRTVTRSIKALAGARTTLLRDAGDARATATAIAASFAADARPSIRALDFEAAGTRFAKLEKNSLLTNAATRLPRISNDLLTTEGRVRDALVADASLVGAVASLRSQRSVFWLTVFAALLAAAALGLDLSDVTQKERPSP